MGKKQIVPKRKRVVHYGSTIVDKFKNGNVVGAARDLVTLNGNKVEGINPYDIYTAAASNLATQASNLIWGDVRDTYIKESKKYAQLAGFDWQEAYGSLFN